MRKSCLHISPLPWNLTVLHDLSTRINGVATAVAADDDVSANDGILQDISTALLPNAAREERPDRAAMPPASEGVALASIGEPPAADRKLQTPPDDATTATSADEPSEGEDTASSSDDPPAGEETTITTVAFDATTAPSSDELVSDMASSATTASSNEMTAEAAGPTWHALRYYDAARGALADVLEGSVVTLTFGDDGGGFTGNAGCNAYFGRLEPAEGASIVAGTSDDAGVAFAVDGDGVGSTLRLCEDALMAQETAYLANFEGTLVFLVSEGGDALRMTAAETGDVVAEYTIFAAVEDGSASEDASVSSPGHHSHPPGYPAHHHHAPGYPQHHHHPPGYPRHHHHPPGHPPHHRHGPAHREEELSLVTKAEFCRNLTALESHLAEALETETAGVYAGRYACSCGDDGPDADDRPPSFAVDCSAEAAVREEGVVGQEEGAVTSTERMVFRSDGRGGAYELAQTSWGWRSPSVAWDAQEVYFWDAGRPRGCRANACASCHICPDGRSVAVDCGSLEGPEDARYAHGCDRGYTGAHANTFRFDKIAEDAADGSTEETPPAEDAPDDDCDALLGPATLTRLEDHMTRHFEHWMSKTYTTRFACVCSPTDDESFSLDCSMEGSDGGMTITSSEQLAFASRDGKYELREIRWQWEDSDGPNLPDRGAFRFEDGGVAATGCEADGCASCTICDGRAMSVVLDCGSAARGQGLSKLRGGNLFWIGDGYHHDSPALSGRCSDDYSPFSNGFYFGAIGQPTDGNTTGSPTAHSPTVDTQLSSSQSYDGNVSSPFDDSIFDIIVLVPDFSTLAVAVEAAGLAGVLSDPDGALTLFAPPNSAFDALPEGLVLRLLEEEWRPQLQDLLYYHVLGDVVAAADLVDGTTAATLNGEDIAINTDPPRINEDSLILSDTSDVEASNGIVHGVGGVLTPASVTSNIVQIAQSNDDFGTLVTAVVEAGLLEALSRDGPFTLFAPTNDAFAALANGTLDDLLEPENQDQLAHILKYHVVKGNIPSSNLSPGDVITLNGAPIAISLTEAGAQINDAANVIQADILANNGIVHAIDAVLIPPKGGSASPPPSSQPDGSDAPNANDFDTDQQVESTNPQPSSQPLGSDVPTAGDVDTDQQVDSTSPQPSTQPLGSDVPTASDVDTDQEDSSTDLIGIGGNSSSSSPNLPPSTPVPSSSPLAAPTSAQPTTSSPASVDENTDSMGRDSTKEEFCQNLTGLEAHMNGLLISDAFKNNTHGASHKCACSEPGSDDAFSIDCFLEDENSTTVRTEKLVFELSQGSFNFNETLSTWKDLTSRPLQTIGNNGEPSEVFPLAACQGDCDTDDECQEGLKCFQRSGDTSQVIPPGCEGEDDTQNDFCYDPMTDDDGHTGLFAQTFDFGVITALTRPGILNGTEAGILHETKLPSPGSNAMNNTTGLDDKSRKSGVVISSPRTADLSSDAFIFSQTSFMTPQVLFVVTSFLILV